MNQIDKKEVFCYAPWTSLYLSATGEIKPCCVSDETLGDVTRGDKLLDAYHSKKLTTIRSQMLNGESPKSCKMCYKKEALNISSRKRTYDPPKSQVHLTELGSVDLVEYLDLTFSNICNLRCRFCGPFCSSKWIDDVKFLPTSDKNNIWSGHKQKKWVKYQMSCEAMIEQASFFNSLKTIDVNGGEPFLSNEHLKFLNHLVESGRSKAISLIYTTNGTVSVQKFIPLLKEFKNVKVSLSTEGVGEVYKYSRGHDVAEQQLEKTVKILKEVPGIRLAVNYTIFALNIFGISNFWEWYIEMKEKYDLGIHLGVVVAPKPLQIHYLPKSFRELALKHIPEENHEVLNKIRNVLIDELNEELDPEVRLELFWEHVNVIDRIQETSLLKVQPIYSEIALS